MYDVYMCWKQLQVKYYLTQLNQLISFMKFMNKKIGENFNYPEYR